jgi:hypothetical protein
LISVIISQITNDFPLLFCQLNLAHVVLVTSKDTQAEVVAQIVEGLTRKQETLSLNPSTAKRTF